MSHSRTTPLLVLYRKSLQFRGWNSAAVMTSVRSSMLGGLMSTMSAGSQGMVSAQHGKATPALTSVAQQLAPTPTHKHTHTQAPQV